MGWSKLLIIAASAAFLAATVVSGQEDSQAEESSIAEILAKLSDPEEISALSSELSSQSTQFDDLNPDDQSGEDTRLRAELLALGYVPGSKQERLKQSEGLDELDMLILRGQRLRSEEKGSDDKLNKLLARTPRLLGSSRQPKRIRGRGNRKRVRTGPKSQRVVIRGRDPRPLGVAAVGAVLEEEEEDVIYEYEYEDDGDYDYVEYQDIIQETVAKRPVVVHKKKVYGHPNAHKYHPTTHKYQAKHKPYHSTYNHHSTDYYHKPTASYGYAKDSYDYGHHGYVPHQEPPRPPPPPPPSPPQPHHNKGYEYYVHVKGEPLHEPYRPTTYPEPVYHDKPYHEPTYHHEPAYRQEPYHEPVYRKEPYHEPVYHRDPYQEPYPEGYYYKDSAPKDPYYKDDYSNSYHSKYGKPYEPNYSSYDHSYPTPTRATSQTYVPEYRSEPVYREHVVHQPPVIHHPAPVHHEPPPVYHTPPPLDHRPGFNNILETGHSAGGEAPELLPEGRAVIEAAPVEGEAFGEDLVGEFRHHTGPFGSFGFYANFFDDGRRVTIGRHRPSPHHRPY